MEEETTENLASFVSDTSEVSDDIFKKAYRLYESGKYQEALDDAEKNSTISRTARGQVLIANSYLGLGDSASAVSHWKKAIEISPLEYNAYINLGNHYYSKGKITDAISNWCLATTIVPENPTLNYNLALAYNKLDSRIKATQYFEKFLKYSENKQTNEYVTVKQTLCSMTAKVDFYVRKVQEYKLQKDIKAIAALYLKIISTYALVPPIYSNIADIFEYDKNYEKALEFYQVVYLYFPFTTKTLIEIANLCYTLGHNTYAYAYYKRAIKQVPEGTSHHSRITSILNSLSSVKNDEELAQIHLDKGKEAAERCDYEIAIDEYENYMIITESESEEIQQLIDKYKIFVNPEPFVISVLYSQIPDLMNKKKLETCIEVCDRIITMAKEHSKEVVAAIKYKSDCKRIIDAREQYGV